MRVRYVLSALVGAVALIVAAASPPAAHAATIFDGPIPGGGFAVGYSGEGSEQNAVTLAYDSGTDTYTLTDTGVATIQDSGGSGCSVAGNVVTCAAASATSFVIEGNDGDDSLTVLSAAPSLFRLELLGGDGADALDASGARRSPAPPTPAVRLSLGATMATTRSSPAKSGRWGATRGRKESEPPHGRSRRRHADRRSQVRPPHGRPQ